VLNTNLTALDEARAGIYSVVTDFSSTEGDSLHFGPLLSDLYGGGNAPIGSLVRIVEDPSNAFARVEVHAADGTWLTVAHLNSLRVGDLVGLVGDENAGVTNVNVLRSAPPVDVGTHGA